MASSNDFTIERYAPDGTPSYFTDSGLGHPQFLAFQVPEPSTWALLGVGMAGLGVALLRRRVAARA